MKRAGMAGLLAKHTLGGMAAQRILPVSSPAKKPEPDTRYTVQGDNDMEELMKDPEYRALIERLISEMAVSGRL